MIPKIDVHNILPELEFTTSRSSGPGGQNVNKVNSKVSARWSIALSDKITNDQKELLLTKLSTKLSEDGYITITSQESRSQLQNKELVLAKLQKLLDACFRQPTPRKASKPTKASKKKRLEGKRIHAEKKHWRRRID